MGPGRMALAVMPYLASSTARTRVKASMPPFVAQYARAAAKGYRVAERADIDDAAAMSLLDHLAGGGLRAVEVPVEIVADHLIPQFRRHVHEGGHPKYSGVVDPDIEFSEHGHCRIDQPLCALDLARVSLNCNCVLAGGFDCGHSFLGAFGVGVEVHDHTRPFPAEVDSYRLADALGSAGHNSDFLLKLRFHPLQW